jgi:alanine racemase
VPEAIAAGVELTVMSERDASAISRAARDRHGRSSPGARAQLAIDTGMTRGGVRPEDAVPVARILAASPGVAIVGTWTHLCCPDDPEATADQVSRFDGALAALADAGLPSGERHLAASGAIFAATIPASTMTDLVRPGLALYGYLAEGLPLAAHARAAAELRPALTLKARPVALDDVPAGTSVGYGATWRADRPSRIATVPVGYGDGYLRATQPGGCVLVEGRRAPIVGIVSMDAVGVDVTGIPGVGMDAEVVLLGSQGDERIDASELARLRNTIVWEVLSGIAARIGRVYHPRTAAGTARDTTEKPADGRRERV